MTDIGIPGYDDADLLGQGGFGVVYKCRQVALNRTVAVKIFRSTDGSMPFETFERECAAIGQLDRSSSPPTGLPCPTGSRIASSRCPHPSRRTWCIPPAGKGSTSCRAHADSPTTPTCARSPSS
ncbi:hypothetical protein [Nostocoides vanveenii]|uniref:hypothetical protein n=1 Tax=Nostocoides vanveenii TaxID=330835 RepID=UPI0031CE9EC4